MNKRIVKYGVLIGIVVAITVFIFSNSIRSYDASRNTSDAVSEIILPNEYATNEAISLLIRKIAHLVEYAALGCAVMLVVLAFRNDAGKMLYGTGLFYVLAVAVIDEHIQSFSDRTSSTGDIILDFGGALIGFLVSWLVVKLYTARIRRCKKTDRRQLP